MIASEPSNRPTVVSLFSGIGGLDQGFCAAGYAPVLLCENWEPARAVLRHRFPNVPMAGDVRTLDRLPESDVVTAGFPCTDFSPAGQTAGMDGDASSLVRDVLRLAGQTPPGWLVLENVRNMLWLHSGAAIEEIVNGLEERGFCWAYRVLDSRFTGVPQRRERVLLLASQSNDPAGILLAEDQGPPEDSFWRTDAYGFHWTEGNRGLGWVADGIPTLKGGSGLGLASPPAVWLPAEVPGRRIARPSIEDLEALQGFSRGWTEQAPERTRWKLAGNAVTTGISRWLAGRIKAHPEDADALIAAPLTPGQRWPRAAYGSNGKRWRVEVSGWPVKRPYRHLAKLLDHDSLEPLSLRATLGFRNRLAASSLRYEPEFMDALNEHIRVLEGTRSS